MKLEALLFDMDGTLADTEELHRPVLQPDISRFRLRLELECRSLSEIFCMFREARIASPAISTSSISRRPKKPDCAGSFPPFIAKRRTTASSSRGNSVRLRPGVARLVEEARQAGVRIGLAATSASVNVQALIATAFGRDAQRAIHAVVCADQVARKKPAPDIYEHLLTMLRTPAAGGVAFEDSANGLAAAKGAGLFTVVTPTRWTMTQKFIGADLVIPTLGDPGHPIDPAVASHLGQPYLDWRHSKRYDFR